ncbi:MAG: DUF4304 domain-containing protein [Chromatiaceae bacterium]|nr:DUF4304 domain-containing protein [Chromatiaceae bacterium]MCP5314083.1 DUF4304 domain-containing protein [Chromatiaceae bacterium]
MTEDRKTIESQLKAEVVPFIRERGFKGSFPDFYRENEDCVCLANFQFYSSGGSFCVNLSYADPMRKNFYFRPETEAKKLKVSQTNEQIRLGSNGPNSDHWFSFGKTSYGEYRGQPLLPREIVSQVQSLWESQAETWWAVKCAK